MALTTTAARAGTAREAGAPARTATTTARVATWLTILALAALLTVRLLAGGLALAVPRAALLMLTAGTAVTVATMLATRLAVSVAVAAL